jgi:hypothetical protein
MGASNSLGMMLCSSSAGSHVGLAPQGKAVSSGLARRSATRLFARFDAVNFSLGIEVAGSVHAAQLRRAGTAAPGGIKALSGVVRRTAGMVSI